MKKYHYPHRLFAVLLALVCLVGLLPTAALAAGTDAPGTITLADYTVNGMGFNSADLGFCRFHRIDFNVDGQTTTAFCSEHGMSMAAALAGHSWGRPQRVTNPTVTSMMAYFYAHTTGIFTDQARAMGLDEAWDEDHTWMMNAWVQATIWRFKEGTLGNPVTACAEELIPIYNRLEGTSYSSIDDSMGEHTFRDFAQLVLDLGEQGVWGECSVYEYDYTDAGTSQYWADYVQSVMVGELNVTHEQYSLIVKKVDATNPSLTLPGARFRVVSGDGSFSKEFLTEADGTYTLSPLSAGTYTVTELEAPEGYEIDQAVQYVSLPGVERTVTYSVEEIAAPDSHVVNSTPQQIELEAGQTETATLVFFNSLKPGIHLIKVDSMTMRSLPNVRFGFKLVGGSYRQEFVTDINGEIDLSKLEPGAYEVRELEAPEGYVIDDAVRVVQVNPDENANFVFTNTPKPALRLIKTSSDGSRLAGVHFRIAKIEDGSHYLDRITDDNGEINISDLEPGVYSVQETATVSDHILDVREYHVELFPGQTSTICLENQKRPNLTIRKTDKDTGDPIPGVTFTLRGADGPTITTEPTSADGTVRITNLLPGTYTVTEQSVPENYILDATPQTVTLFANREAQVEFQNYQRPTLKIAKVDVNGKSLTGAIFTVTTKTGVKIGDWN